VFINHFLPAQAMLLGVMLAAKGHQVPKNVVPTGASTSDVAWVRTAAANYARATSKFIERLFT
jgi:hypothetical protein